MKLVDENILKEILNSVDNFLFDCDGVIWGGPDGRTIINNAHLLVNKLSELGKRVFFVTNNSVKSQNDIYLKCKDLGINIKMDSIISAPYIMGKYLKDIGFNRKVYVMGSTGLYEELTKAGLDCIKPVSESFEAGDTAYSAVASGRINLNADVGAVAVGFHTDFNYAKLVKANCYLANPNCLFLANNRDERYPVLGTMYHLPAAGVLTKALETSSGRSATVIGKPATLMFEVLAKIHQLKPENTMMVGDTLFTDIVFGRKCGLQTLFVLSGVSTLDDVSALDAQNLSNEEATLNTPHYYVESLGHVMQFL